MIVSLSCHKLIKLTDNKNIYRCQNAPFSYFETMIYPQQSTLQAESIYKALTVASHPSAV